MYDYIRDWYASNSSCLPRSMEGKSRKCSGSGGGNSCRGMSEELCGRAKPWRAGAPLKELVEHPWETYQPPKGVVEGLGSWGSCAFVATGETVRRVPCVSSISNLAKLIERCSEGAEDHGAEEVSWGMPRENRHVSFWKAVSRAHGSPFSANDLQRLEPLLNYFTPRKVDATERTSVNHLLSIVTKAMANPLGCCVNVQGYTSSMPATAFSSSHRRQPH